MRSVLFTCLMNLCFQTLHSQGIQNFWLMGYDSIFQVQTGRTTLDFNSSFSISYQSRPMNFGATVATLSDSSGNLQFYSNGVYVANRNDSTMLNGDNLNPSFYTSNQASLNFGLELLQANIVLPHPGDFNRYYLFHCTLDTLNAQGVLYSKYIYYSEIDMSLDGGLGAVFSKNTILLEDSINQGGFSACKHGNGRDWWIVSHQLNSDQFIKFLLTPDGISGPFRQAIGSVRVGFNPTSVFSKDGSRYTYIGADQDAEVFDFDRCTGVFSNCRKGTVPHWQGFLSGALSASGRYLYVTNIDSVFQFDLNSIPLDSGKTLIAVWDSTYDPSGPPYATLFHTARLAPDNRIYISTGNTTRYLHVILFPDSASILCTLQQHAIILPTYNDNSLPYHPNYFANALGGSICDTLGLPNAIDVSLHNTTDAQIFPNPFHDRFYFRGEHSSGITFRIFNSLGRELPLSANKVGSDYYYFVTDHLENGIYFLETISKTFSRTIKLIKY